MPKSHMRQWRHTDDVRKAHTADEIWFAANPQRQWRARPPLTNREASQLGPNFPGARKLALVRRGAGAGASWVSAIGLPFDLAAPPAELTPGQLDALISHIVTSEQSSPEGAVLEFECCDIPNWSQL